MKFMKCMKCGKVLIIEKDTPAPTICCGEAMTELKAGESDGAFEKHVPVVSVDGNKVHAAVGSVEHPMMEEHYIMFIVLETDRSYQLHRLNPGEKPEADFLVAPGEKPVAVYEYCNLHGLWKAEL
ncbi:MAG: desulfoferrodoxin Dfx [Lachnospiraceae bacterium]|jgi:superoxide reductase|nr:desulfoferrodoxin Dfx [Lachnospiraceae bacterium]